MPTKLRGAAQRWHRALVQDRGAVTAEFAILLPVLVVVVGFCVGAIALSAHRVSLTSAAAEIARLEARGDSGSAAARISSLGGVSIERTNSDHLLCVTLHSQPADGVLSVLRLSARGCAAVAQ